MGNGLPEKFLLLIGPPFPNLANEEVKDHC